MSYYQYCLYRDIIPDIPDYTLVLYYRTRTVMVQLPMRVLHGICYSSPTVVRISHLMWLTKAGLW